MRPFAFERVADERARAAAGPHWDGRAAQYLAGGTTLLDLMKLDVMQPMAVHDIGGLAAGPMGRIEAGPQELRLGALVTMAEAARHATIRRDYPVVAESLLAAASQQIRNMASLGGNLLQRTRCPYFRDTSWAACNKRKPGSGCAARDGFNRMHAVLGTSPHCIATYPGDFAVALVALDARLEVASANAVHGMAVAELHRQPGDSPHVESVLEAGELITAITVPAAPWTRRSLYVKVRDRQSYEFALASAAVALDLRDGLVREARIALGGVATVPWRARSAEGVLTGRALDERTADEAAEAAFADAKPFSHNGFKIPLGKRTVIRALLAAARMEIAP
jgi:xanthine dehydrogenase YagS FAD-binding subunit